MPVNDSSTGGYLAPTTPPPLETESLDDLIGDIVAGVTGLPRDKVRPRWQPVPPKQPEANVNWVSVGVTEVRQDPTPAVIHDSRGEGSDTLRRHDALSILAGFYGPQAQSYATLFRDGLYVAQNREAMSVLGFGLIDFDALRNVPQQQNSIWISRFDLPFRLRRRIDRTYPVRNILKAGGIIHADGVGAAGSAHSDQPWTTEGHTSP